MKYLKLFKTETDRDAFLGGGDLILPNVSVVEGKKEVVYKPKKTMITFTIKGIEYQAEKGMTWGEWCSSEYNTSTCFISGSFVITGAGCAVQLNGYGVVSTDVVISGSYTIAGLEGQ